MVTLVAPVVTKTPIPESPAKLLLRGWKKPQAVKRQVPPLAQFEAIVAEGVGKDYCSHM